MLAHPLAIPGKTQLLLFHPHTQELLIHSKNIAAVNGLVSMFYFFRCAHCRDAWWSNPLGFRRLVSWATSNTMNTSNNKETNTQVGRRVRRGEVEENHSKAPHGTKRSLQTHHLSDPKKTELVCCLGNLQARANPAQDNQSLNWWWTQSEQSGRSFMKKKQSLRSDLIDLEKAETTEKDKSDLAWTICTPNRFNLLREELV